MLLNMILVAPLVVMALTMTYVLLEGIRERLEP